MIFSSALGWSEEQREPGVDNYMWRLDSKGQIPLFDLQTLQYFSPGGDVTGQVRAKRADVTAAHQIFYPWL